MAITRNCGIYLKVFHRRRRQWALLLLSKSDLEPAVHCRNADYSKTIQVLTGSHLLDPCDERVWNALQDKCTPPHEIRGAQEGDEGEDEDRETDGLLQGH